MKAVDLGLSVFWGEAPLEIPNKHFEERLFTWGDDSYNFSHKGAHEEDDFEELANYGIITDDGFLTRARSLRPLSSDFVTRLLGPRGL